VFIFDKYDTSVQKNFELPLLLGNDHLIHPVYRGFFNKFFKLHRNPLSESLFSLGSS
jgi:hypothetical protein